MIRLHAVFRSVMFACAIAAGALGTAAAQPAETVLRFIPQADLSVIDPHWTAGYITRNHGYMVYDTLFALDHDFRPQPQMVESWTVSDDKRVWTFTLRDGLRFHDGQPVRPADVIASLRRWGQRNAAYGQPMLARVTAMEATGDKSFRIALSQSFPMLDALGTLSTPTPFILPERLAATDAYTALKESVGSGPFKFVASEWQPGHKVVYVKNRDYVPRRETPDWVAGGKVAKVDRVEWVYVPDATTAAAALAAGEVDRWEVVPNDTAELLAKNRDVVVEILSPVGNIGIVRFNHLHPPFDNPKMRQALLAIVDQREYMTAVAGDPKNWNTCFSVYACNTPMATDAGAGMLGGARDFARAKQLVRDSGYNNEKIVVLTAADFHLIHAQAVVTESLLKRLGLNVELVSLDWGTLLKRRASQEPAEKGGWSVFATSTGGYDLTNPATNAFIRGNGLAAFPGWPTDPAMEELVAAWFAAPDAAAQRAVALTIERRAFETVPYIPTGQFPIVTAFRKTITGRVDAPFAVLWNIEKRDPAK